MIKVNGQDGTKKNIEEDTYFTNEIDYIPIDMMSNGNQTKDFQLTIEMAKELSMMARTDKGKQARQYFIELEKQWNSPEAVMARALKMADAKILSLQAGIQERDERIKELTPAANLGNAIRNNEGLIIIRGFVKVLANIGIKIRQCDLFSWLVKNDYLYQNKHDDYLPCVRYVHSGLFKVAETPVETKTNGSFISYTTRLTTKGQEYFINKLKEEYSCQAKLHDLNAISAKSTIQQSMMQ